MLRQCLTLLVLLQGLLGLRVIARLIRTSRGSTIMPSSAPADLEDRVSIIVPVLNERDRLPACLDGLIEQGDEVSEILVVDGGSTDATPALVRMYEARDRRIRLIDASPIPDGWNGKSWGLQAGLERAHRANRWILTIDADVRPTAGLTRSLLAHAHSTNLSTMSVATRQEIEGIGENILHPAMLSTLVYRFGIPGSRCRRATDVQANGQCFLVRRDVLERAGSFASVHNEICEDVTLARRIVEMGEDVGFFEADDLVSVRMYSDWRATWREWPRSLPMRDRYFGVAGTVGLIEVLLVQALPLPLLVGMHVAGPGRVPRRARVITTVLAATRVGILVGTRRAYPHRRWSYWFSPLADLAVAARLVSSAMRREHAWRGRRVVRGTADSNQLRNSEYPHGNRTSEAATHPLSAALTVGGIQ